MKFEKSIPPNTKYEQKLIIIKTIQIRFGSLNGTLRKTLIKIVTGDLEKS